jgi:hypothetical protein
VRGGVGPSGWCSPTVRYSGGLRRHRAGPVARGVGGGHQAFRKWVEDGCQGGALRHLCLDNGSLEGGAVLHTLVLRGKWCGKDLVTLGGSGDWCSLKGA